MSISSEISRLQGAKSTLKTKINAKNDAEHQIDDETLDEFGGFVDTISTGNLTNEEYEEANNDADDILEDTTVPSGTISITTNGIHDVTNYVSANVNIPSYPPDWSQLGYSTVPAGVIEDFNYSKNIYDNWDSTQTDLVNKFYNNRDLVYMPLVDTSNVYRMTNMFKSCSNLKTVSLLNTSNCTNMGSMFEACSNLQNIPILDTSKVEILGYFVKNCNRLTDESLNNIMKMCINATETFTQTKTLALLGLTSEQATRCQSLSNYQDFLDAGWTTGY